MENVIDHLRLRGFIQDDTGDELKKAAKKPMKVYCGFDPTADSLHLGNLVAIMGLAWFQRFGHTPVVVVGGATGMIGDPSGKSDERQLLTADLIEKNLAGIKKNLESICIKEILPLFFSIILSGTKVFLLSIFYAMWVNIFALVPCLQKTASKNALNQRGDELY
jgi:tyrosyl-tRNA synthetase